MRNNYALQKVSKGTMSHTPGHWSYHSNGRNWFVNGIDRNGVQSPIADVCHRGEQNEQPSANARLIAAAPDLLAVCESIMELPELNRNNYDADDVSYLQHKIFLVWDSAKQAIAKAKVL